MNEPESKKKQIRNELLALVKLGDEATIHKISKETNDDVVRRAIAASPLTSSDTLKSLAIVNSKTVRKRIAGNPNTPFKTLVMLESVGYEVDDGTLYISALRELTSVLGEDVKSMPEDWLIKIAKSTLSR